MSKTKPATHVDSSEERRAEQAEAHEQWLAERRAGRVASLLERIPPAHLARGELHAEAARWVKRLLAGETPNLVLAGDVGCGKTWHAWHATLAALEAGWDGRVQVVTATDFRVRTTPRDDGQHHTRALEMGAVDLLVLDDVGALRSTDWSLEVLYGVVDHRFEQLRPTVVTTNLSDLTAELGPRIASRLARDVVIVSLDGPDRRRS